MHIQQHSINHYTTFHMNQYNNILKQNDNSKELIAMFVIPSPSIVQLILMCAPRPPGGGLETQLFASFSQQGSHFCRSLQRIKDICM